MEEGAAAKKRAEADELRKQAAELEEEAQAMGGGSAKKAKKADGNATSKPDSSKSTAPGEEGMPILVDGPATFGGKTQQERNLEELALAQAQSSDSMNAADEWERNYYNFWTGGNAFEQMFKSRSKPDGDTSMGGATSALEDNDEQKKKEAAMTRYAAAKKGANGEITGQRCYRKDWEKDHSWLECRILEGKRLNPETKELETAKYQACFCKACERCKYDNIFTRGYVGGIKDGLKLEKIKDHANSSHHQKAVEAPIESENFKMRAQRVLTTEVTALLHIICMPFELFLFLPTSLTLS
jgi:hypothetical protein